MDKNYNASKAFLTAALLTFSGGFQDAYTYCARGEVFANGQTGNVVLMAGYIFHGDWGRAFRYFIPLCAFIIGVFTAELIHRHFRNTSHIHWRQLIVMLEIVVLFAVGAIPHQYDIVANVLVSLTCALQVQSFRKVGNTSYVSTMCIGNLRGGAESLCSFLHSKNKSELYTACVYFGVILIFSLGSGIGFILTDFFDISAIRISCIPLILSFGVMIFSSNIVCAERNLIHGLKRLMCKYNNGGR
ncbi:MAG: YoaK family protein [Ruminococcus sp.]